MLLTDVHPGTRSAFAPASTRLRASRHLHAASLRSGSTTASCSPSCSCAGRRSALLTTALALLTPAGAATAKENPIFAKVKELEALPVNTDGAAEEHQAKLEFLGAKFEGLLTPSSEVQIEVPFEQPPFKNHGDDYIQYIWVKDADNGKYYNAKKLTPNDRWTVLIDDDEGARELPPFMQARIPVGANVIIYCYCTKHGLWERRFTVPLEVASIQRQLGKLY